jgi:aromatic-amino-acid transaminase
MATVTIARQETPHASILTALDTSKPDALLALIRAFRDDPRPNKIDVGVGVYRDTSGQTPVFRAIKQAERRLLEMQPTKSYLGPEGDIGFFEALLPLALGRGLDRSRVSGLQTPGGTGALRLGAELIRAANPGARVFMGEPTWPNHAPIFEAAGLQTVPHPFFDVATQTIDFAGMLAALSLALPGDVLLLHGCCHNPTGADLDADQWRAIADLVAERDIFPFIDLAYQGLGEGLENDAAGMRRLLDQGSDALIAYSCDKNFGLYRERTGALMAVTSGSKSAAVVQSNLLALARANWSMPPDHGAAVTRIVLEDEGLATDWRAELETMRTRIVDVRAKLAAADPRLTPLLRQHGMFSMLPLSPVQVARLRDDHAVYMPGSGRINIAGLVPETLLPFVAALAAVRDVSV